MFYNPENGVASERAVWEENWRSDIVQYIPYDQLSARDLEALGKIIEQQTPAGSCTIIFIIDSKNANDRYFKSTNYNGFADFFEEFKTAIVIGRLKRILFPFEYKSFGYSSKKLTD